MNLYDAEYPYEMLSQTFVKFRIDYSSFAIDRRTEIEQDEGNFIVINLGINFRTNRLLKLLMEKKRISQHILQKP